jgi:hypothetical protein
MRALAKGKHGVCKIFKLQEEASKFVLGTAGSLVHKFKTRGEALAFLESTHQLSEVSQSNLQPNLNKIKNNRNSSETAKTRNMENCRPLLVLTGPEPLAKKSDEVFGTDLGHSSSCNSCSNQPSKM